MSRFAKILLFRVVPLGLLGVFALDIFFAMAFPKKDGEYHVRGFGRLPVLLGGRIQPFDSIARNALLQIRSTGDVPLEEVPAWKFWHHPKKLKATEWLLEAMARPEVADTRPIFLIHFSDLLGELKLQDKGVEKSGLRYYSFSEIKSVVDEILTQGQKANEVKSEQQTTFQKQVSKLANAVTLYQRLKLTLQPEGAEDFAKEIADFRKNLPAAQAAAKMDEGSKNFDKAAIERVAQPVRDFNLMAEYGYALIAPPVTQAVPRDHWQNAGAALLESAHSEGIHPAVIYYAAMATAYRQQKPAEFNRAVAHYEAWLAPRFEKEVCKGRAEFYYNDSKPFLHATIIYIFAFVLAGATVLTLHVTPNVAESLRRSAFWLLILAGLVHTFGLVFRMVLEARPPVTNLYSSAIFIGWAVTVVGIIVERIYRVGIGILVGGLAGFVTLLIAHNLALGGDTMEMLRAVLDTNFWLATHVVVITLGYASTFCAGLLAILYVCLGLFTPLLTQKLRPAALQTGNPPVGAGAQLELGNALSKMVYGVVCFATLFSFVGTVLGGIWADQSWGRFWGWDPKENGALLIVLWNAIILHARWGGLVRERGIMNLAVVGNIVTSFSWFGVNMLGIGLHSYGFMESGAENLMNFMVSQLVILGNGALALSAWRSFPHAPGAPSDNSFRSLVIALDITWALSAVLWFGGVYARQQAAWFGAAYDACPWLELAGKIGSLTTLGGIWVLAAFLRLRAIPPREPQAPMVPVPAPPG
jgi:cytochrome c-type biogenesis protein CcsB